MITYKYKILSLEIRWLQFFYIPAEKSFATEHNNMCGQGSTLHICVTKHWLQGSLAMAHQNSHTCISVKNRVLKGENMDIEVCSRYCMKAWSQSGHMLCVSCAIFIKVFFSPICRRQYWFFQNKCNFQSVHLKR